MFGKVIEGFEDVFKVIENTPTGAQDRPREACVIANCGVYEDSNPPAAFVQEVVEQVEAQQ